MFSIRKKPLAVIAAVAVLAVAAVLLVRWSAYRRGPVYDSRVVDGIPNATETAVVHLKDGDEYTLSAGFVVKSINGVSHRMLAYNGSIPGPQISVDQGAEVTIHFRNDIDQPTLLHSHGVRMDNPFDGAAGIQTPVPPGGSFDYHLRFPDAGVYWYHPHVREDFQQELGLYGQFLVVPTDPAHWGAPVNREVPLFLDDLLVQDGRIPLNAHATDHALMGRYGNVMLLNGENHYALSVRRGEVVRFFLTNAAGARPFNVAIRGARLKLVGTDGGAYERDTWVNAVTLGPSERAVVDVLFDAAGEHRIVNAPPGGDVLLGVVHVSDEPVDVSYAEAFGRLAEHAATVDSLAPFRKAFKEKPAKTIHFSLGMGGGMAMGLMVPHGMSDAESRKGSHVMDDGSLMAGTVRRSPDGIEWDDVDMRDMPDTPDELRWEIVDEATGAKNMDIDWTFSRGEAVPIRIINFDKGMHPMQHPMHFHGQRFVVVARDGVPETNMAWKDTVLVPAGHTADIVLEASNPGRWMAHCHIAEHLESGMMMEFTVK